jgi:hypothetical protein
MDADDARFQQLFNQVIAVSWAERGSGYTTGRDAALRELFVALQEQGRWIELEEVGRPLGVTRERIRQIIHRAGANTGRRGKKWRPARITPERPAIPRARTHPWTVLGEIQDIIFAYNCEAIGAEEAMADVVAALNKVPEVAEAITQPD